MREQMAAPASLFQGKDAALAPPSCCRASLQATPAGLDQTLCSHSKRPRAPQNPGGVTTLPTAPALRWPCGQGKHQGQSPSQRGQSHPAPSTTRGEGLPGTAPCASTAQGWGSTTPWHGMGAFKHDLAGTRVLTALWGHGCECTPKQTHLYEYCIVYIIFFFLPK